MQPFNIFLFAFFFLAAFIKTSEALCILDILNNNNVINIIPLYIICAIFSDGTIICIIRNASRALAADEDSTRFLNAGKGDDLADNCICSQGEVYTCECTGKPKPKAGVTYVDWDSDSD
jgi:hypothetical protein